MDPNINKNFNYTAFNIEDDEFELTLYSLPYEQQNEYTQKYIKKLEYYIKEYPNIAVVYSRLGYHLYNLNNEWSVEEEKTIENSLQKAFNIDSTKLFPLIYLSYFYFDKGLYQSKINIDKKLKSHSNYTELLLCTRVKLKELEIVANINLDKCIENQLIKSYCLEITQCDIQDVHDAEFIYPYHLLDEKILKSLSKTKYDNVCKELKNIIFDYKDMEANNRLLDIAKSL